MLSLNRTALVCAVLLVVAGCTQKTNIPPATPAGTSSSRRTTQARTLRHPTTPAGMSFRRTTPGVATVASPHDAGRDVVVPHDAGRADATHDAAPRDAAIVCS